MIDPRISGLCRRSSASSRSSRPWPKPRSPLTSPGLARRKEPLPWEGGGLLGREVHAMPTYVTLAKWTDEGIRNVKDSPKRRQAFEDRITTMGGKVKDAYLMMGEYDLMVVTEVPNDETAAKMVLGTAMQGNVRTVTMRAF